MTQRARLDHFLVTKAAEAGAAVRDGVKVTDVRATAIAVDGIELSAPIVIDAGGGTGTAANELGFGPEVVAGDALQGARPRARRGSCVGPGRRARCGVLARGA